MFGSAKKEISQEELSNSSNIIGKGTSLEGNLNTAGNLRVEGKVKGNIQTKAKVVLGETAVLEGNIIAQTAEISGEVQGTITVSGLLTLKPTAVVNGDITTSKLVFEEGAKFNGKCNMGNSFKETKATQPPTTSHKKNESPIEPHLQQVTLSQKGG
ncbi:MAG TPA: cell shape determination protein CcmA [Amoebophilaceae bacterium]|nr:cell shape determination protein CcmA [Amoebophilaceae bacterium]